MVAELIGCGIRPRPKVLRDRLQTPDEAFNDQAEALWIGWSEMSDAEGKMSFYEAQRAVLREFLVAGEVLIRIGTPMRDTGSVPMALEVIPSERLSLLDVRNRKGANDVIQGIELDANGLVTAYHIWPHHPNDFLSSLMNMQPERVPAREIIHIYQPIEQGQIRGLTRFLTVAGAFEALAQYLDFELTKARVASAFAVMITQQAPGLTIKTSGGSDDLVDEDGNPLSVLDGGIIFHGKPGEGIQGVGPSIQSTAFDAFVRLMLRSIARGLDISYELIARDLDHVTYLSARQGENQDRRHWEPQQQLLIDRFLIPVWKEWIIRAGIFGFLPIRREQLAKFQAVEWVKPGWDWIDPSKDIQGDVLAIQAGLRSPLDVIQKRGNDPWKVLNELEQFKIWATEKGLDLSIFQPKAAANFPQPPPVPNGNGAGGSLSHQLEELLDLSRRRS